MTRERLKIPERNVREYAHELAYKLACDELATITDVKEQCHKSGARYSPAEATITIEYLNQRYRIGFPGGGVFLADSEETVPLRDKILLLHYFTHAKGSPLTGQIITYKELQEGINYYPTFFKRAIEPIVANFKDDPQKLLDTAGAIGGRRASYGDIAVKINALPRVPLTIVMWRGDSEFSPDGNIMFDRTITDYLPTEDITILCEIIVWKLVRLLKTGSALQTGQRPPGKRPA